MKFLLVAAFVALCTASTVYRGKNITVGDDGTIQISTSGGKRVLITRPSGFNGQKKIDIQISGPYMPTKRIQINDDSNDLYNQETEGYTPWSSANSVGDEFRLKRSSKKTQGDSLVDICKEFQGTIDETLFQKLLLRIQQAVQKGEINRLIYEILVNLDQIGEGGIFGLDTLGECGPYGQCGQYGQGLLNTPNMLVGGGQIPRQVYGNGVYGYGGLQGLTSTPFVNPLLGYYQQGNIGNLWAQQQLNRGLLQGGSIYDTIPTNTENVLLKEYLNQQQSPVSALWRSMANQPWLGGIREQSIYGQQPIVYQGQQYGQQGSIANLLLNRLRQQEQGIVGQGIVGQGLDSLVQQQQPVVVQTLGGLVQQQRPMVGQTLRSLVQQQQEPIVLQTLERLAQQQQGQPIVLDTLGRLAQQQQGQPIVVDTLGRLTQQQQGQPIVVDTLGRLGQQQPIVMQTLGGLQQQQGQPIIVQRRVPQVVY